MNEFCVHPNVYATGSHVGLLQMLEKLWVRDTQPGKGSLYAVSGFANYNGGVRFYPTFKHHTENGGQIRVLLAGSTSQRISSKQVVKELLRCKADVRIVNRKRLVHMKCYGYSAEDQDALIVTSGNFTGPGMSQNVEASLLLGPESASAMNFKWAKLWESLTTQKWDIYQPRLKEPESPAWKLLYDEIGGAVVLDESQEVSMIVTLGHHDTARIQADRGTKAAKGSQYFWLSRDCFDFFPPLTIRNTRGAKATFSTIVNLHYVDIGISDNNCRVTFEAENNLDFRLGTGKLRYTKIAKEGDLAVMSRLDESDYELRIINSSSDQYRSLAPFAVNFIGNRGKRFGYLTNLELEDLIGVKLPKKGRQSTTRLAFRDMRLKSDDLNRS